MIIGIGIDIVEIARVERLLERHGGRGRERVFTAGEIAYCDAKRRAPESYAARFAAKEAFFKAVRTGWGEGLAWTEIEVRSAADGAPELRVSGAAREVAQRLGVRRYHLSLSHTDRTATAFVILEG